MDFGARKILEKSYQICIILKQEIFFLFSLHYLIKDKQLMRSKNRISKFNKSSGLKFRLSPDSFPVHLYGKGTREIIFPLPYTV